MRAKIEIVWEDDGRVNVTGPLQDRVLMYGLLGMAQDATREYKVPPAIMTAPAGALRQLPGLNGK